MGQELTSVNIIQNDRSFVTNQEIALTNSDLGVSVNRDDMLPATEQILDSATMIDENPIIAADEDLIEREWIDRAKRIIEETKSDPHKQDDEVNKLQADYINKRYSKKLGSS